jgi:CobQ-like glutamine amidotransferase family enzyme
VTGSVLDIGVVLPDLLGTYSDTGNATVLAQRARWRASTPASCG